jgi:hypothetical protein
MQWLLYGKMTGAVTEALVRHGHQARRAEELGIPADAELIEVLKAARQKQWDILTTDAGLVNTTFEQQFHFNRSIVFLQLEGGDGEQDDALGRLFDRYRSPSPRRLYTVTASRVKIRQLPGATRP